jgi:hypothetical protein
MAPMGAQPERRLELVRPLVAHRGAGRESSEVELLTDICGRPAREHA